MQSPCIQVCRIDDTTGWCVGCGRTRDEIARWGTASNSEQARIWQQLPERLATLRDRHNTESWSGDAETGCLGLCDPDYDAGVCRSCGRTVS